MNHDSLSHLAQSLGIAPAYFDINGQQHFASDAVLNGLIHSLQSSAACGSYCQTSVFTHGDVYHIPMPERSALPIRLQDEQGQTHPIVHNQDGITLPPSLPCGYYTLFIQDHAQEYRHLIIIAPSHAYQPPKRPHMGLTIQLYALKSEHNWGIGDFDDLIQLASNVAKQHIDFIGINPLHALYTSRPDYASPYSPSSRHWLNPIYLSVPRVARYLGLDDDTFAQIVNDPVGLLNDLRQRPQVAYAEVWTYKVLKLRHLFQIFQEQEHPDPAFAQFCEEHGERLYGFALFEALDNQFVHSHASKQLGWLGWDSMYHDPNSPAVSDLADQHQDNIRFYMWLQWLCALQMADVHEAMQQNGITLGLYGDLAVGVAQGSADTWLNREQYCLDLSIGAPPDPFSPIGQNWQLPPYHPHVMAQTGFAEFIRLIRENMKLYSILRIDHVMALNRLWLIMGQDADAENGAYVHYPQEILFAIIALESHRHRCVVVGEDLGTVPDDTRALLHRYQIYSYKVLYFHKNIENFPECAIAVTSTHDLAPLAGYWESEDLRTMFTLGTLPDEASFQAACAQRESEKTQIIQLLKQKRLLPQTFSQPETLTPELALAIQLLGASSPAQFYAVQLENLLNMKTLFNVPSVATGNWVQKYPYPIYALPSSQLLNTLHESRMATHTPYPTPDQRERDTINALFLAEHGDVFAYLGRHHLDGVGDVVRVLLPNVWRVDVIDRTLGKIIAPMTCLDERGFWVCVLPEAAPDYALSIHYDAISPAIYQDDPYRYGSFLGDTDHWLLAQGKQLRPYETLGAHFREIHGVHGAYFAVWAPNAQRVSVIGEFNHWDGRIHVMRHHQHTGIWEIFIPDLPFNALYKFEIRDTHGKVRVKADPYAFAAELRPTTASVLRGLPEKMPMPTFRQSANAIDAPIAIYEVHLGSWKRQAENNYWLTYEQLATELIDYVKDMGFTHIELLPLSEYPFDGSWGYQATGLYAPTSRFGSPQQLQALIQAAHDAGICVILDWVVGHFPSDEHGLRQFDGTPLYEHADPREGYHQDWNTLIYNFGRHEVRNFLTGNALYWIERFGFDGLRVDAVASMIYRDYSRKDGEWIPNQFGGRENLEAIDFLRDTNAMLHEQQQHAASIAEESTSFPHVTHADGLHFQYKWNMGWMNDTLRYMREDPINRKYHHQLMTFGMMYQYSEHFVLPLSHDEVVHGKGSLLAKMPGDCWQQFANLRAYYGFMYGFPGKKLLFMGNEFAQGREWNYNEGLDWFLLGDEYGGWHTGVQDFVRDLNHVYRQNAPLYQLDQWREGFDWLVVDDADNSVFVFERRDRADNRVIVISNFTPVVREHYRFGVNVAGEYRVILNSDETRYQGSEIELSGSLNTENVASHGRAQSLCLTLPPLATVYLRLDQEA